MRSSFVLALAWLVSLPMCLTAQTPLVNINFTEKGGVNTGTFEKELKAFDDNYATVVRPYQENVLWMYQSRLARVLLYEL